MRVERYEIDLTEINLSLEERGWFFQENFVTDEFCKLLLNNYFNQNERKLFGEAKIGIKNSNITIRNGSVLWVDDWNSDSALEQLNLMFSDMMNSLNNYFRLSMKSFESQFSIYNQGGFYKCHLDQHSQTKHRQISCCLYLNDCIEGGELVIFKRRSKEKVDKVIKPLRGSIVLFFSADIYHKVNNVNNSRYSITTWFRDDVI